MKSHKNYFLFFVFLIISVFCQTGSMVVFKKVSLQISSDNYLSVLLNPVLYSGFVLLGLQTIFWQTSLRHIPLSIAYMGVGLSYPLIMLSGYIFFGEAIHISNIAGTLLITTGVFIIFYYSRPAHE